MEQIRNEDGYSLLEMIITIAIIAVAISMTSFGLGTIYSSNVKNYSSQVVSEIKSVQIKRLAAKDNDFRLEIEKPSFNYIVETIMIADIDGDMVDEEVVINTIEIPSNMSIKKEIGGIFEEIDTIAATEVQFTFDPSSGAETSGGAGVYQMSLSDGSNMIEFEVIAQNGRVFVHE